MSNPTSVPANALYETAKALHAQGRFAEAERLYRQLMDMAPAHLGLLQRLTEICYRSGRTAEAIGFSRKAVALAPNDAQMLSNLGVMLHQLRQSEEALPYLERSLAVRPASAQTHTNRGMVLAALDRRQDALESFSRAAALDPRLAAPHNNIGNLLSSLKRYEDAVAAFQDALALEPGLVEAWSNLGNALFHLRRFPEAVECFQRALALDPAFAAAHYNWGTLLGELGHHDGATEHYLRARQLDPSYVAACNNLGRSLNALGRPEDAIAAFKQALTLDPNFAVALAGLGSAYLYLGRMDEAREACKKAVSLGPDEPGVYRAYGEVTRFERGDPAIAQLERLAARDGEMDDFQRADLHFALAKVHSDCGEHERAFDSLLKGNAARRRMLEYDEAVHLAEMKRTAAIYTPELLRTATGGDPSEAPIFVLGMPRSGTTLIEQILASHPKVHGAGEVVEFGRAVVGSYRPDQITLDPTGLLPGDLGRLGARYISEMMTKIPAGTQRFTDKMPANFRFAGLIHMVLPNARIIHVHRDPLDTCFSCYSKLFNGALEFTYDLSELGRYYAAYEKLMAHWRRALPEGVMLDVCYEDLVNDLETGARRLVEFCGLDWAPACLDFHKTDRPVITASTAQVRQPVYKTSIGRWRPYAPWLGPLQDALGKTDTDGKQ